MKLCPIHRTSLFLSDGWESAELHRHVLFVELTFTFLLGHILSPHFSPASRICSAGLPTGCSAGLQTRARSLHSLRKNSLGREFCISRPPAFPTSLEETGCPIHRTSLFLSDGWESIEI